MALTTDLGFRRGEEDGSEADLESSELTRGGTPRFRLRQGCVSCREMPRSAHRGAASTRDFALEQLITQRSLVQIQPPQPIKTKG
jgi:hypothetical protein